VKIQIELYLTHQLHRLISKAMILICHHQAPAPTAEVARLDRRLAPRQLPRSNKHRSSTNCAHCHHLLHTTYLQRTPPHPLTPPRSPSRSPPVSTRSLLPPASTDSPIASPQSSSQQTSSVLASSLPSVSNSPTKDTLYRFHYGALFYATVNQARS